MLMNHVPDEVLYQVIQYIGVFKQSRSVALEFPQTFARGYNENHVSNNNNNSNNNGGMSTTTIPPSTIGPPNHQPYQFKALNDEYVTCSLVCRRWNNLLHDPVLWRREIAQCQDDLDVLLHGTFLQQQTSASGDTIVLIPSLQVPDSDQIQYFTSQAHQFRLNLESYLNNKQRADSNFLQMMIRYKNYQLIILEKLEENLSTEGWADQTPPSAVRTNLTLMEKIQSIAITMVIIEGFMTILKFQYPTHTIFYPMGVFLLLQLLVTLWNLGVMFYNSTRYRDIYSAISYFLFNRNKVMLLTAVCCCVFNNLAMIAFIINRRALYSQAVKPDSGDISSDDAHQIVSSAEQSFRLFISSVIFGCCCLVTSVVTQDLQNVNKPSQGSIYGGAFSLFLSFQRTLAFQRSFLFLLLDFVGMAAIFTFQETRTSHGPKYVAWTIELITFLCYYQWGSGLALPNILLIGMTAFLGLVTRLRLYHLYRIQ